MKDFKKQNNDFADAFTNAILLAIGTLVGAYAPKNSTLEKPAEDNNKKSHHEDEAPKEGNNRCKCSCNSKCKSSDVDDETYIAYINACYSVYKSCFSSESETRKIWHKRAQDNLKKLGRALGLEE